MKRVWKPLDVKDGLRLYRVHFWFCGHPEWNQDYIVAANSPSHAAELMRKLYDNGEWIVEPVITGHALNVYQPASWWEGEE